MSEAHFGGTLYSKWPAQADFSVCQAPLISPLLAALYAQEALVKASFPRLLLILQAYPSGCVHISLSMLHTHGAPPKQGAPTCSIAHPGIDSSQPPRASAVAQVPNPAVA